MAIENTAQKQELKILDEFEKNFFYFKIKKY